MGVAGVVEWERANPLRCKLVLFCCGVLSSSSDIGHFVFAFCIARLRSVELLFSLACKRSVVGLVCRACWSLVTGKVPFLRRLALEVLGLVSYEGPIVQQEIGSVRMSNPRAASPSLCRLRLLI